MKVPMLSRYAYAEGFPPDWVEAPERLPEVAFRPYKVKLLPKPDHALKPEEYFAENPWGSSAKYRAAIPEWRRDPETGHVMQKPYIPLSTLTTLDSYHNTVKQHDLRGGVPGVAKTTPYAVFRGHPGMKDGVLHGPAYFSLDVNGTFWQWFLDGRVEAIWGRVPVDPLAIARTDNAGHYKIVGAEMNVPGDFCYDYLNRFVMYIADTHNHRILRVDREPGKPAGGGPSDPALWTYSVLYDGFGLPTSIDQLTDGRLLVVDNAEGKVYVCERDGSGRSVLLSKAGAFQARAMSDRSKFILTTTVTEIIRVDSATLEQQLLHTHPAATTWPWVSVDVGGVFGRVDDVMFIAASGLLGNTNILRIQSGPGPMIMDNYGYANAGWTKWCQDVLGHYMWVAEIHPELPLMVATGIGNQVPLLIRPLAPDDSRAIDTWLTGLAWWITKYGTVDGWPVGLRPSFYSLRVDNGFNFLGLPMFEVLAEMSTPDLTAYIQSGMGGSVPRPEIVGYHLAAMIYWIDRNSPQFAQGRAPRILWPQAGADAVAPVVSNVQVTRDGEIATVTWTTNKPSYGYVAFGPTADMHRSKAEDWFGSYSLTHTATLEHLFGDLTVKVFAQNVSGYLSA